VRVGAALRQIEDAASAYGGTSSSPPTVVIVGAGYAGVEMATVVAERVKGRARVRVVTPNADILDGCPEGQRLAAGRSLGALGVEVITGRRGGHEDPSRHVLHSDGGGRANRRTGNIRVGGETEKTAPLPDVFSLHGFDGSSGAKVTRLEHSETTLLSTSCTAELSMDDGTTSSIPADLVIWTAGSSPATRGEGSPTLPGAAGSKKGLPFPMSARGSIQTVRSAARSRSTDWI